MATAAKELELPLGTAVATAAPARALPRHHDFVLMQLLEWISVLGPENTLIGSDLGQAGFPRPVDAFRRVGEALLDLGLAEKDLRRIVHDNPRKLLSLTDRGSPRNGPGGPITPLGRGRSRRPGTCPTAAVCLRHGRPCPGGRPR